MDHCVCVSLGQTPSPLDTTTSLGPKSPGPLPRGSPGPKEWWPHPGIWSNLSTHFPDL